MTEYRRFNILFLLATPRVAPCLFLPGKDDTRSTEGLRKPTRWGVRRPPLARDVVISNHQPDVEVKSSFDRNMANLLRRSRPLTLPGEIYGQHRAPGVEPLPFLGPRLDIGAQRGDYTQVGDGVQRALVSSPHQSRSWTYQIYLHPLAYPLLWKHGFPFLPRQLNFQHSTLTVTLGTLYFPMNSRGSIRSETSSRTRGLSGSWGNLILPSPCAQPVLTFACNAAVITIGKERVQVPLG
jgi:hypothetical protein